MIAPAMVEIPIPAKITELIEACNFRAKAKIKKLETIAPTKQAKGSM